MKEKITVFIDNLILYDYILFGSVLLVFILLLLLSILLRRKVAVSVLLLLSAFALVFLGPTLGYIKMHQYLFKNKTELISQKKLHFTKAVVVKGLLSNESQFDFSECKITASAYKVSGNALKDFLFPFNPFKKMSIVEEDIPKGQNRDFKIIVEPFTYSKEYNISLEASCR